jgi:hypothetical protein
MYVIKARKGKGEQKRKERRKMRGAKRKRKVNSSIKKKK